MLPNSLNTQVVSSATIFTVIALIGAYTYYRRKKNSVPEKWTAVGKVKQLFMYPLKSGRRREIQSAECTRYGVSFNDKNIELRDRAFVVYGEDNNEFKTARTFPKMVLIETSVNNKQEVVFTAPGENPLTFKIPGPEQKRVNVLLHKKEPCEAVDCGDEAAAWLSNYMMDKPTGVRLGYHRGDHERNIEKHFAVFRNAYKKLRNDSSGLYQDLTSYLLINQASLDNLNANLQEEVNVNNFRPNILIEGQNLPPYAEETWEWYRIGDAVFRSVKPCTRCVFTTIDPETGVVSTGREPLKSLGNINILKEPAHVKCEGKAAVMGVHMGVRITGRINVGDEVYVG